MRAVGLAVSLAACYSPSAPAGAPCTDDSQCPSGQQCVAGTCGGTDVTTDAADAPPDVPPDSPALCTTWTAEHFDPCAIPAPGGDLNLTQALSGFTWDTSSGELKGRMNTTIPVTTMVLTQVDGPDVLLASVQNLAIEAGANLNLGGSRALLIAVWGTATIDGDIDAGATFSSPGPGGSSTVSAFCGSAPTGNTGSQTTPATGGGGGALHGNGGRGGNAVGGAGVALATPTIIRGGCAGGSGGGSSGGTNASRGAGGGALQITARTSITVSASAQLEAGGGGGGAGVVAYGGGGGGGAGGYIGFDAPTVSIAGTVAANGGAGGGGASDVAAGSPGGNGSSSDNAAVGGAGAGTSNVGTCVKGGNGSSGGTLTGDNANASPCGGGGGGGGAGYILIWSPSLSVTGIVSPPVTGGP